MKKIPTIIMLVMVLSICLIQTSIDVKAAPSTTTGSGLKGDAKTLYKFAKEMRKKGAKNISLNVKNKAQYRWKGSKLVKIKWINPGIEGGFEGSLNSNLIFPKLKNLKQVEIANFHGVKKFSTNKCSNLESLKINMGSIKTFDINKNKKLKKLEIGKNYSELKLKLDKNVKLETLKLIMCTSAKKINLKKNVNLKKVTIGRNAFTELDFSKNIKLKELYCGQNQLKKLNISKNVNLIKLDCSDNGLKKLDVSKNVKLKELTSNYNSFKTLDIRKNIKLKKLMCLRNYDLTTIYASLLSDVDIECEDGVSVIWS